MGTSSNVWTAEGFLLDDLFNGTGIVGTVYADRHLVVSRTVEPFGLRFAGEIDISNSGAVAQVVRAVMHGGEPPHLDLSRLSFCDVSGLRALHEVGGGGRLVLDGLPEQLRTLMRITGWWNADESLSAGFPGAEARAALRATPLSRRPAGSSWLAFDADRLLALRRAVSRFATACGMAAARAAELATAVNELATNSVLHGGGSGTLRMWKTQTSVTCEVTDNGSYERALADRERPGHNAARGLGLGLAKQLCDLVQIRAVAEGTVVRLHMRAAI